MSSLAIPTARRSTLQHAPASTKSGLTFQACHNHPEDFIMESDHNANAVDRRIFLGAGTASVLGLPTLAIAQQQSGPVVQPAPTNPRKPLGDVIATFATGFALA